MKNRAALFVSVVSVAASIAAPAMARGVATFGPSPYLSFADSPFSSLPFNSFFLENFEDGFDTPGVSASSGVIVANGPQVDSVDGDDGAVDGNGNVGASWYPGLTSITFTFDAMALGGLPTHVGVVWTDVGNSAIGFGVTNVTFTAYDSANVAIASFTNFGLGDGSVAGGTDEDRFFGASSLAGIARIEFSVSDSSDWELDHLQYGIVPTPGATALAAIVGVWSLRRRRSSRSAN